MPRPTAIDAANKRKKTMQTCETCKFWKQKQNDSRFGNCTEPYTFAWVRGDSFEPPGNFGCINYQKNGDVLLKMWVLQVIDNAQADSNRRR